MEFAGGYRYHHPGGSHMSHPSHAHLHHQHGGPLTVNHMVDLYHSCKSKYCIPYHFFNFRDFLFSWSATWLSNQPPTHRFQISHLFPHIYQISIVKTESLSFTPVSIMFSYHWTYRNVDFCLGSELMLAVLFPSELLIHGGRSSLSRNQVSSPQSLQKYLKRINTQLLETSDWIYGAW